MHSITIMSDDLYPDSGDSARAGHWLRQGFEDRALRDGP